MTRQQERRRWYGMLYRCENPQAKSYRNYGGRGIQVCEQWHDFEVYYADIMRLLGPLPDPRMSLDRIDNDGDYEPGNVRWATCYQQVLNSRVPGSIRSRPWTGPPLDLHVSHAGGWLTPADAGVMLGIDETAVMELIHTGRLRAPELFGKHLIDEHALAEYMHAEGLAYEVRGGQRHLNQVLALRRAAQAQGAPQ